MKVIILLCLLLSTPCYSSPQDIANVLILVDWAQTRYIADSDEHRERNMFLGKNPTTGDVNKHFIITLIGVNLIGELLPKKYSKYFYIGVASAEAVNVVNNYRIGVRFRF